MVQFWPSISSVVVVVVAFIVGVYMVCIGLHNAKLPIINIMTHYYYAFAA